MAAPLIAGPAAEETLDSPSEALLLYSAAVCDALVAVSFAASVAFEAVLSNRALVRPMGSWAVRRKAARDTVKDIFKRYYALERVNEMSLGVEERGVVGQWIEDDRARNFKKTREVLEGVAYVSNH